MKKLAYILSIIVLSTFQAFGQASLTFRWEANTESDLAGYKLYWGTSSRTYTSSVVIPVQTTYKLVLNETGLRYFALTAFDSSNNESGFSNEVSKILAVAGESPEGTRGSQVTNATGDIFTLGPISTPDGRAVLLVNGADSGGLGFEYYYHNQIVYARAAAVNWYEWVSPSIGWRYTDIPVSPTPPPADTTPPSAPMGLIIQ